MSAHPSPGRPVFEPADRVPALGALRGHVHRQDWDAVADFFATLTDEDDRAAACRVVAEQQNAEQFLNRAMARDPRDPLARSLLADRLIQVGWGIRSGARAHHVSRGQFQQFHAFLQRAEVLLIDVCAEHPDHALAWYLRTITARGLELGQGETLRRYERLSAHHPHHYCAQMQVLEQLCPKWGGTWKSAHGFADECAKSAPAGGPNGALVALVQMEQYLELREKQGDRAAGTYLRTPEAHRALVDAAGRSVLHPDADPDAYQFVGAHSAFAAAHCAAGRHSEAAPHFRALGDRATDFPWGYMGGYQHETEFVRHRKTALAKG